MAFKFVDAPDTTASSKFAFVDEQASPQTPRFKFVGPDESGDEPSNPMDFSQFQQAPEPKGFPGSYPAVTNPDGSVSNVLLGSFEIDGKHYVIPTMESGKKLTEDEAVKFAMEHGIENYPSFNNQQEADSWAKQNHDKFAPPEPIRPSPRAPVGIEADQPVSQGIEPLSPTKPRPTDDERGSIDRKIAFAFSSSGFGYRKGIGEADMVDLAKYGPLGAVARTAGDLIGAPKNDKEYAALLKEWEEMPFPETASEYATAIINHGLGGAPSIENAVPIGRAPTLAKTMRNSALIISGTNSAVDSALQLADVDAGIQKDFSGWRLAVAALAGAGMGGLIPPLVAAVKVGGSAAKAGWKKALAAAKRVFDDPATPPTARAEAAKAVEAIQNIQAGKVSDNFPTTDKPTGFDGDIGKAKLANAISEEAATTGLRQAAPESVPTPIDDFVKAKQPATKPLTQPVMEAPVHPEIATERANLDAAILIAEQAPNKMHEGAPLEQLQAAKVRLENDPAGYFFEESMRHARESLRARGTPGEEVSRTLSDKYASIADELMGPRQPGRTASINENDFTALELYGKRYRELDAATKSAVDVEVEGRFDASTPQADAARYDEISGLLKNASEADSKLLQVEREMLKNRHFNGKTPTPEAAPAAAAGPKGYSLKAPKPFTESLSSVDDTLAYRQERIDNYRNALKSEIGLDDAQSDRLVAILKRDGDTGKFEKSLTPAQRDKMEAFFDGPLNTRGGPLDDWIEADIDIPRIAKSDSNEELAETLVDAFGRIGASPEFKASDEFIAPILAINRLKEIGGSWKDVDVALKAKLARMSAGRDTAELYGAYGRNIKQFADTYGLSLPLEPVRPVAAITKSPSGHEILVAELDPVFPQRGGLNFKVLRPDGKEFLISAEQGDIGMKWRIAPKDSRGEFSGSISMDADKMRANVVRALGEDRVKRVEAAFDRGNKGDTTGAINELEAIANEVTPATPPSAPSQMTTKPTQTIAAQAESGVALLSEAAPKTKVQPSPESGKLAPPAAQEGVAGAGPFKQSKIQTPVYRGRSSNAGVEPSNATGRDAWFFTTDKAYAEEMASRSVRKNGGKPIVEQFWVDAQKPNPRSASPDDNTLVEGGAKAFDSWISPTLGLSKDEVVVFSKNQFRKIPTPEPPPKPTISQPAAPKSKFQEWMDTVTVDNVDGPQPPTTTLTQRKAVEAKVKELRALRGKGRMGGEAGSISMPALTKVVTPIATGAGGAAYGSTQGDTPEERRANMVKYGLGGVAVGLGLGTGIAASMERQAIRSYKDPGLKEVARMLTPKKESTNWFQLAKDSAGRFRYLFNTRHASIGESQRTLWKAAGKKFTPNRYYDLERSFEQLAGAPAKAEGEVELLQNIVSKLPQKDVPHVDTYITLKRIEDRLVTTSEDNARLLDAVGKAQSDLEAASAVAKAEPSVKNVQKAIYEKSKLKMANDKLKAEWDRKRVAGWSIAKARGRLEALQNELGPDAYARIEAIAPEYQAVMRRALQIQVDSGRISQDLMDKVVASSDFYARFKVLKYFEDERGLTGTGMRIPTSEQIIKKITGIYDEDFRIASPLAASAEQVYKGYILAEKNLKMRKLATMARIDPEHQFYRILKPGDDVRQGYQAVTYFDKGQPARLEVTHDIAESLNGLNLAETGVILNGLGKSSTLFKLGATALSVPFNIANALVFDPLRLMTISKYGFRGPQDFVYSLYEWPRAIWSSARGNLGELAGIKPDALYEMYMRSGIPMSTLARVLTPESFASRLPKNVGPGEAIAGSGLGLKPVVKIAALITNTLEETTRLWGVQRAMRIERLDKLTPLELQRKWPEIVTEIRNYSGSPDFARFGAAMRPLNIIMPFLNPRWQGFTQDFARLNPLIQGNKAESAKAWARLTTVVGIPATMLAFYNLSGENAKDYFALPKWERQNYWPIPMYEGEDGKSTIIDTGKPYYFKNKDGEMIRGYLKIPKREFPRLLSNTIEDFVEYMYAQDVSPEKSSWGTVAENFMENFLETASPFNLQGDTIPDRVISAASGLNPAIKVPLEVGLNKNFFTKRDIVPEGRVDGSPELQYSQSTPELYKTAAGALPDFKAIEFLRSPAKLQHITEGFTGGFARQFAAPKLSEGNPAAEAPDVLRRFYRSEYTEQGDLMDKAKKALRGRADQRITGQEIAGQMADSILTQTTPDGKRKALAQALDSPEATTEVKKYLKEELKDAKRGLTYEDRTVKRSFTVVGGFRARYYLDKLKSMPDEQTREAYINDQKRKDLLTGEIWGQMAQIHNAPTISNESRSAAASYVKKARSLNLPPDRFLPELRALWAKGNVGKDKNGKITPEFNQAIEEALKNP